MSVDGTTTGTDGSRAEGGGGSLCMDECGPDNAWVGDGECDDGGPDSDTSVCDFGTDCMDCGGRNPEDCVPSCDGRTCGSDGCGGTCGSCSGTDMCIDGDCVTCECPAGACGMNACGMDCGACADMSMMCYREACRTPDCAGRVCGRDGAGGNCGTMDGACPDGQGCLDGMCVPCECGTRTCGTLRGCGMSCGTCTDPAVCDNVMGTCVTTPDASCNNTCGTAGDNECDDGGTGAHFSLCDLGTDCADCGPR